MSGEQVEIEYCLGTKWLGAEINDTMWVDKDETTFSIEDMLYDMALDEIGIEVSFEYTGEEEDA